MRRKLAVILAADVAGYSRMVSEDEEDTLRRLTGAMALFRETISRFEGRVFNTAGDAVLAEFQSAVNAVRCAIEVQENLKTRNASYPPSRQLQFRIGLTIGDIVEENGDLLGDGVNIAARLESIAPVGGLAVSRSVYDAVAQKIRLPFVDAGDQNLKNIPEPVRAYTLALVDKPESPRPAVAVASLPPGRSVNPRHVVLGASAIAVCLAGAALWWRTASTEAPTVAQPAAKPVAVVATPAPETPKPAPTRQADPPAPAIVPAVPTVPAPALSPSAPVPPAPVDRTKVDTEYEACRRAATADAVRLCGTLVAANVLDTSRQSEVYVALGKAYRESDQPQQALAAYNRAIAARPTAEAYVNRGIVHFDQRAFESAVADFSEAIALAPNHGEAHNNKAWTLFKMGNAKDALADADKAVKLLSTEAYVWDTRGHINEQLGNRDAAIGDYRQAIALDPTHQSSRDGLKRLGATP